MVRLLRITVARVGLVVVTAAPAAADAAEPSDFRSEVTGIVPATDGVDARDPWRRRLPRAQRRRRGHGHRGGLRGRALPPVPARRHGRAQPPLERHVPERRPEGRRGHPGGGAGGRARYAAGVGAGGQRRHLRLARPPHPLDGRGVTGASTEGPPSAGPTTRGGSRSSSTARRPRSRAPSPSRTRSVRSPTSRSGWSAFALVAFVLPRTDPAGRLRPPRRARGAGARRRRGRVPRDPRRRNPLLWALPAVALAAALVALVRGRRPRAPSRPWAPSPRWSDGRCSGSRCS